MPVHFVCQPRVITELRRACLTPSSLPPAWVPRVLRLRTPLFRLLASRMLCIDPQARSSRADDLALGRPTESAALSGKVVRLAARLRGGAPPNARFTQLVKALPDDQRPRSRSGLLATLGLRGSACA